MMQQNLHLAVFLLAPFVRAEDSGEKKNTWICLV